MTSDEYNKWVADFVKRYPAVGEYVKKRPLPDQKVLHDTWHRTLSAYPPEILWGVTDAMISGHVDPVANVDLGQFGEQIRQRCRQVLELERKKRRPKPADDKPFQPLAGGNMSAMLRCLKAAEAMQIAAGRDSTIEVRVTPWHWSGAVIILADDHSEGEAATAHATLRSEGLDWAEVRRRAAEMGEVPILRGVEDEEVVA